ncbi:MAG: sugar phosphate isomerase/epimerase [Pirellulaceae bacterium]|nr:sugar phosphate isomerase/epimerase [Pirellulaceae bacterium]
MLQLRPSLSLAPLGLPLKKSLPLAAQLGAKGVEIDLLGHLHETALSRTAIRELRKRLGDYHLKVSNLFLATQEGTLLDQLERNFNEIKQGMESAYQLGASTLTIRLGRIAPTDSSEYQGLLQLLTDLGQWGQRCGALLTLAPNKTSPEDLSRLLADLPTHSLGIYFDPAKHLMSQHDPVQALTILAPHILQFAMHDATYDYQQDEGHETALGRGSVDFAQLLTILEQQRFPGYLTIIRQKSENLLYELSAAIEFTKNFG